MTTDQLIHYFLWLIISSMWCIGVHAFAVKVFIEEVLGTTEVDFWEHLQRPARLILKPLFACPACMASVHGTLIYFFQVGGDSFSYWVMFCICLCGLNFFVSQFFNE